MVGMFRRKKKFGGYTVDGVPVKEEKNRGVQIVMALDVGVLFGGPLAARLLHWHPTVAEVGVAVAGAVLLLVATAVWAIRTWNY